MFSPGLQHIFSQLTTMLTASSDHLGGVAGEGGGDVIDAVSMVPPPAWAMARPLGRTMPIVVVLRMEPCLEAAGEGGEDDVISGRKLSIGKLPIAEPHAITADLEAGLLNT